MFGSAYSDHDLVGLEGVGVEAILDDPELGGGSGGRPHELHAA
jgi:hypothetical protein